MTHDFDMLAEHMGVNYWDVRDGIKVRPTHNNILAPTLGVGGYCLPKDALLALYAADKFFNMGMDKTILILRSIAINDLRPLRSVQLALEGLRQQGKSILGANVSIMGVSYKAGVDDTRYSPSETAARAFLKLGARVTVHDPYVKSGGRWKRILPLTLDSSMTATTLGQLRMRILYCSLWIIRSIKN